MVLPMISETVMQSPQEGQPRSVGGRLGGVLCSPERLFHHHEPARFQVLHRALSRDPRHELVSVVHALAAVELERVGEDSTRRRVRHEHRQGAD